MTLDRTLRALARTGLIGVLLCTGGCSARVKGTIPPPAPKGSPGVFRAGAGVADLTPIPGIPMAGYSMGGKIARGAWVNLRARALYLEDQNGDALVIVACDLDQIDNGLSDRVAELLHATPAAHLSRAQVLLAASHTHHGPGSYFTSRMYNSFTGARKGFDADLFEFLAVRIVDAIQQAYANKVPAILRTAPAPGTIGAPNDRLPCVFRNRSRAAFERNPSTEVTALRGANPLPGPCPARCPDPLDCQSVHTRIDYFSVVDAATPSHVIGVGVFLAAHATVLSTDNELYSPDFFGVTSTLLETGVAGCLGGSSPPVVAVFNGAEGDVSPGWVQKRRDRSEVLEIATDVAKHVCTLLPAAVDRPNPDIAFRWGEVEPLTDRPVDDPFDRRCTSGCPGPGAPWEQRTARTPQVGIAALGGAEDGRTMLHEMGFVEGTRGPVRDDQGAKETFRLNELGINTSVTAIGSGPPPEQAPIGVYRLGNLVLVTMPGEFTTMLGDNIRDYVASEVTPVPDRVVLIGLAGGHVSYITTPEEYDAQHYEGGQNIYGAATGPLLTLEIGALAKQLGLSAPTPGSRSYCYDAGSSKRWRARDAGGPPYEVDEGVGDVVQDLISGMPKSDFPTYCFRDAVPRLKEVGPGGCLRTMPEVWIETNGGAEVTVGGMPQNSRRGLDIATVLTGVGTYEPNGKDATEWCAIWMTPAAVPAGLYRFRIEPIVGPAFTSPAFDPGVSPPYFGRTDQPLRQDRRDCSTAFEFLGLCCEPQTCQAPY